MTATTGMRRRFASSRPSTAAAGQRASEPLVPIGQGGTGERTAPEAAAALGVPTLAGDNAFAGETTFAAGVTISGSAQLDVGTGDVTFNGLLLAGNVDVADRLRVNGGMAVGYVAKTADYAPSLSDDFVVNVTANSPTITLPTAVAAFAFPLFIIKNSGAGIVTLATTSSQTIDGAVPGVIAAGGVLRLFSDGANWQSW